MPSEADPQAPQTRVAAIELVGADWSHRKTESAEDWWLCRIEAKCKAAPKVVHSAEADSPHLATVLAVSSFCSKPLKLIHSHIDRLPDGKLKVVVAVEEADAAEPLDALAGFGQVVARDEPSGMVIACLRAANNAGLLKADFRANHQKFLREWASESLEELIQAGSLGDLGRVQRLECMSVLLETMNRVASAAVVTAANYPRPDSILSLFDTSAWLFDRSGRRRDAYTDTTLWLAWYPGIENGDATVDTVINSMPAAPDSEIPWIVKLFENPTSWLRFRGAVDLEDHDVLHVLLGRGLQDQDEAFVLGFAMGTAKRVSQLQVWIFKLVLSQLYPEPYRIPKFLFPAFDLGLACGKETGVERLYQMQLKELRNMPLKTARLQAGIDMNVLRRFYELEQQRIPFTIASLRLP